MQQQSPLLTKLRNLIDNIKSQSYLSEQSDKGVEYYNQLLSSSFTLIDQFTELLIQNSNQYQFQMEENQKVQLETAQEKEQLQLELRQQINKKKQFCEEIVRNNEQIEILRTLCEGRYEEIGGQTEFTIENKAILIKQIQEQNEEINALKNQIQNLLSENQILAERLSQVIQYIEENKINELVEKSGNKKVLKKRIHSPFVNQSPFLIQKSSNQTSLKGSPSPCPFSFTQQNNFMMKIENKQNLDFQRVSVQTHKEKPNVLREILHGEESADWINLQSKERVQLHKMIEDYTNGSIGSIEFEDKGQVESQKVHKVKNTKEFSISEKNYELHNPYYTFFILTAQCAKINSGNLQLAILLNINQLWNTFQIEKVPIHFWYRELKKTIRKGIEKRDSKKSKEKFNQQLIAI